MSITQKRVLAWVLAVLMCISVCSAFCLPSMTAGAESATDPYAKIKATVLPDGTFQPAANVYFLDKSLTAKAVGESVEYTYGDKTTWGNGVTYTLSWGVNLFNDYANLYKAVKAQNATWSEDVTSGNGEAVLVFAPGSNGSIYGSTAYALPDGVTNPMKSEMFALYYLGPQAGKSPVGNNRSGKAAADTANGRSSNTSREFVWTSTFWFPDNVIAHMDGFAGTGGLKIYSEMAYSGLYLENFYADKLGNSNSWQSFGVGGTRLNTLFHMTDCLIKYNGTYGQSNNSYIYSNDFVMDNVVFTGPSVKSTTDLYSQNQHIQLFPTHKNNASANFYGDQKEAPRMTVQNSAFVDWESSHLFRFNMKITAADNYMSYSNHAVNVTFRNNYFYDVGTCTGSQSDILYVDMPTDVNSSNNSWQLNFLDNTVIFSEELVTRKSTYMRVIDTCANSGIGENVLTLNFRDNHFVGYVENKYLTYFWSCTGLVDLSGNLFTDYDGNIQPMVASFVSNNFNCNYNVSNDLYVSGKMQGGIRETFAVRQINGGKDAVACYCYIAQKRVNSTTATKYLNAALTVWLKDGVTYDAKKFISFDNKNVKYHGLYEDADCTAEVTSVTKNTVNGLYAKASLTEGGTTCTVLYKINLPTRINIVVPDDDTTEYTFNGVKYSHNETANDGISAYFYSTYTAAYSAHENPNVSAANGMNDIIVMAPGTYNFTSQWMGKSVCVIGPQFGVNPYDVTKAATGQYANGRSFDPSTEAVLKGFLGAAADQSLSYVFDGLAFTGVQAIEVSGTPKMPDIYQTVVMGNLMVATTQFNGAILNADKNGTDVHRTLDVTMHGIVYDGKNIDRVAAAVDTIWLVTARSNFFRANNIGIFNDDVRKKDGTATQNRAFYITLTNGSVMPWTPAKNVCKLTDSTIYNSRRDGILYSLRDGASKNANFTYYPGGAEFTVSGVQLLKPNFSNYLCGVQNGEQTGSAKFIKMTMTGNLIRSEDQNVRAVSNYQTANYLNIASFTDDSVIRDNIFDVKRGTAFAMYNGNKINVDENVYSVNTDNGWIVYPLLGSSGIEKSAWYYVGSHKNTDFALADNGYKSFSNDGVNLYNLATIYAKGALTKDSFKVGTGASVTKLYNESFDAIDTITDNGIYYICVQIGSDKMLTKATVTVCKHTSTHENVTKQPNCTENGKKDVVCDNCEAILNKDISISANGHVPGEWDVGKAATCAESGLRVKKCTVCGDILESDPIAATGLHTPSDWTVLQPEDCMNNGIEIKKCTVCAQELDRRPIISSGEHNFIGTVLTQPSCTVDGEIEYKCSGCNTSFKTKLDKKDHNYKATVTLAATCTEDGVMTYACKNCTDNYTDAIPSNGSHSWGDWTVITPASCSKEGSRRHTCANCNLVDNQPILKVAHTYSTEFTIDIQPTGTVSGEKSRHCLFCTSRTDVTSLGYCAHNTDDNWVVDREPTCTVKGEKHQVCSDCGDNCNITPINMLPHNYKEGSIINAPTCTDDGEVEVCCTECGHEDTMVLPALKHSKGYWKEKVKPTCTAVGQEERRCINCSDLMETREIPATGHSLVWTVTTEATCTAEGVESYLCGNCGHVDSTRAISALGHKEHYSESVAPTCTTEGNRTYICDRCDNQHNETIAATGHKAGAWKTKRVATTLKAGLKVRACTVCGTVVESKAIDRLDPIDSTAEFKDVSSGAWYKNAVDFAVGSGLFSGTSAKTFDPEVKMTRGMLVTVLGRLAGVDASKYTTAYFEDVGKNTYYFGYIEWARQNDIVSGTNMYIFEPDRAITRQEICKIIVAFSDYMDITLTKNFAAKKFTDAASISSWARGYVNTCQRAGIISGDNKGMFRPTAGATRAEVATILMNYCKNFL